MFLKYNPLVGGAGTPGTGCIGGGGMWDGIRRAVRDGVRGLTGAPVMSLTIVGTLALGVGSVAVSLALLDTVLSGELPSVVDTEDLVFVDNVTRGDEVTPVHSNPNYEGLRDAARDLVELAAYRMAPVNIYWDGLGTRSWGYLTSTNYFDVLKTAPALGRTYADAAERPAGSVPIVVISHALWERRFGRDPNVVGKGLRINSQQFSVIGVAPQGFIGAELLFAPDFWAPLSSQREIEGAESWLDSRRVRNLFVLGRLRDNRSFAEAEAGLAAAASTLAEDWPEDNRGYGVALSRPGLLGATMQGPVVGVVGILLVASIVVLIAVGVNIASLVVTRALERGNETRVRVALGASRIQLLGQVLAEQSALAFAAGTMGCVVAWWTAEALAAWNPSVGLPIQFPTIFGVRSAAIWMLISGFGISMAVIVCCALVPVAMMSRPEVTGREDGRTMAARMVGRQCVLVVQVAATVIFVAVGTVVRDGLLRAMDEDLGMRPDGAVSMSFDLKLDGFGADEGVRVQRRIVEALEETPGVDSVGTSDALPLSMEVNRGNVELDGRVFEGRPSALVYSVSQGYFGAVGSRIRLGRGFRESDDMESVRVAVVNEAFVRRFGAAWQEGLIGRRVRVGGGEWRQVVGVVETGKYVALSEGPTAAAFVPVAQGYRAATSLVVRSDLPPNRALAVARDVIQRVAPGVTVYGEGSLEQRLGLVTFPSRVTAAVLGGFGIISLVLALTGTVALVANSVARKRRDTGVRRALGAGTWRVVGNLMRGVSMVVALGGGSGLWERTLWFGWWLCCCSARMQWVE